MKRCPLTLAVAISLVAFAVTITGCTSPDNSSVAPDGRYSPMGRDGRGDGTGRDGVDSPMGRDGRGDGTGRDGQDNRSGRGGMMGQPGSSGGSYASDGERIFLSGVGADGRNIARSSSNVSEGSLMMGGGGCASCHGVDGRGATIRMMGGADVQAPDITYNALIEESFTDASIATAIRDGVDEKGERMDAAMPRWQMSETDVDAIIAYLKVLSAR